MAPPDRSKKVDRARAPISDKIQQRLLEVSPVPDLNHLSPAALLPKRMVLTGFMGAGKSTTGVRLAEVLGWTFIDLDEEIVHGEQQSIAEIFAARGEASFRQLEHRALAAVLARPQVVLALGGGAVETAATRQLLSGDPETLLIYLEAPLDVLIARCEQQEIAEANAARRPVLERRAELAARFQHRRPLYESAHWTIPTAGFDTVQIVQTILSRWNQHVCGFPDSTPDPPPNPTRHPTR